MDINTALLTMAAFMGGCALAIMAQQWLQTHRWPRMRRRIDTLIKLRVEQQLHRHEAECPMAQMHAQRNILYSPPAVKSQSHQMLVGFMMTYYPDFLKQLTAHTDGRLSDSEEHTCFLIKLGLRNKQIAQSMGITPNSVIKTKQRLRQKLKGLPADEAARTHDVPWRTLRRRQRNKNQIMTTFLLTLKKQLIMSTEQMKQCQAPATHAPAGNKMTYTPPQMEVIKMDLEGVIAGSGNLSDFTSGSTIRQSSTRRGYNSASSSDLEDLINDILTVEQ